MAVNAPLDELSLIVLNGSDAEWPQMVVNISYGSESLNGSCYEFLKIVLDGLE